MSNLFFSKSLQEALLRKFIFVDSDVLGELFENNDLLKELPAYLGNNRLYVHPFTVFEFLRDVHFLEIRSLKQKFIDSSLFSEVGEETHLKSLPRFMENAMLLSQIYTHQNYKDRKGNSSFVDLILGAVLMALSDEGALITANYKDFPSCIFDTLAVFNSEQKDGQLKVFGLMAFNKTKFDKCSADLKALGLRRTVTV